MGIDNRNSHDMIRSDAGRHSGRCAKWSRISNRRGVRVLFSDDDVGIRAQGIRERRGRMQSASLMAGKSEQTALTATPRTGCRLLFRLLADQGPAHPLVFETGRAVPSDEATGLEYHDVGAYQYPFVPMVDKYKWLENAPTW